MHSLKNDIIKSFLPNSKYFTYGMGTTNMVITAPHGGGIRPISIPDRKYGVFNKDTYTRRLTEDLALRFGANFKPYVLVADIHRKKVDLNREIKEGAQGNKDAELVWKIWNDLTKLFIMDAKRNHKKVLYVEIHSHNDNDLIQLGYHLGTKDYLDLKNGRECLVSSTMDSLSKGDRHELLFGFESIEARLERMGYKVMTPISDDSYFNGGRGIDVFSNFTLDVGAIQIELPISLLRTKWRKVSSDLCYILSCFRRVYLYDYTISV